MRQADWSESTHAETIERRLGRRPGVGIWARRWMACYARDQPGSCGISPFMVRVRAEAEVAASPRLASVVPRFYGKDKCGTTEKAGPCPNGKRRPSRRAMASLRACRDRCLDRSVERQNPYPRSRNPAPSSARIEGEGEMTWRKHMTAVGLGGAGLLPAGVCGSPAWPARAPISCDFRLGSLRTGTGGNGILRRFGWG